MQRSLDWLKRSLTAMHPATTVAEGHCAAINLGGAPFEFDLNTLEGPFEKGPGHCVPTRQIGARGGVLEGQHRRWLLGKAASIL